MNKNIELKLKNGFRNTNCFIPLTEISEKIKKKDFKVIEDESFLGFIKKTEYDFSYLYFYIQNKLDFKLDVLKSKRKIIVEIIFSNRRKESWNPILEKFYTFGFDKYTSFNRMIYIKQTNKTLNYKNNQVIGLREDDLNLVKKFLEKNFDIYAEKIPTLQELRNLSKTTYLIKINNEIAALLISDKNGFTEELRYWLVDKKYRGEGFGGILMKYFLNNFSDTKTYLLWVQENNQNAIEKYQYFGFKKDKLSMYILKNKN